MVYVVDLAIDLMRKISSSEPVMFSRDGILYVASKEGFAQVARGGPYDTERKTRLEVKNVLLPAESDDGWSGQRTSKFSGNEGQHFQHIVFGTDSDAFTLEDITKAAEALSQLPDDGLIRIAGHGSQYHSHKYGYAADGMDFWVRSAEVVDRNAYLESMRESEQIFAGRMEAFVKSAEEDPKSSRDVAESYANMQFFWPDCLVLTPNILVSFPRYGELNTDCRERSRNWAPDTSMYVPSGSRTLLRYWNTSTSTRSPWKVSVTMNSHQMSAATVAEMRESMIATDTRLSQELAAVQSAMPAAEDLLGRINHFHNGICRRNIEFWEEMRKKDKDPQIPLPLGKSGK